MFRVCAVLLAASGACALVGFGGGWVGVKDNGVQKGAITPNYETRLFIR